MEQGFKTVLRVIAVAAPLAMIPIGLWWAVKKPEPGWSKKATPTEASTKKGLDLPLASPAIQRQIDGGQTHRYQRLFEAETYVQLMVEQSGIDLVVEVHGPDRRLMVIDSPNGTDGAEPVYLITRQSGWYRFDIRAGADQDPGSYRLTVVTRRPPARQDRARASAAKQFFIGEELRRQRTNASLEEALAAYDDALPRWAEAGEIGWQATTHERIGRVEQARGRVEAAITALIEARDLLTELGDASALCDVLNRLGQVYETGGRPERAEAAYLRALDGNGALRCLAAALNNAAVVAKRQGRREQALARFHQALGAWRALEDLAHEAVTLSNLGELYASIDELERARGYVEQALDLRRRWARPGSEARTLANLGKVLRRLGELEQSADSYLAALDRQRP